MSFSTWVLYLVAILILTASPGPSVLLCISKSVTYSFRVAFVSSLGILIAIVGIMTLSFTGLGVVIATSDTAFSFIKWSGVAYLLYLGVQAIRSKNHSFEILETETKTRDYLTHWFSGFVVGASNPKAIVFFTALFPQFINTESALLPQYIILVATFAVMELFWLSFYSALARRSTQWLSTPGRAKRFNQVTGGVFIGTGLLLSTTGRASVN